MAERALGTQLKKGTVAIAELTSIGGLDLTADTIDVTALDSTGGYRKFLGGFKDGGEVAIQGFFNPGDAGQADLYADFQSGAEASYTIAFPAAMNAQWEFTAVVVGFSTSAELEDAVSFESTLKVSGEPILNTNASGL